MNSINRKLYILATIIVVTVFICIGLYWAKATLRAVQFEIARENGYNSAYIRPCGLLSEDIEAAPDVDSKSSLSANNDMDGPDNFGIGNYFDDELGLLDSWLHHSATGSKGLVSYLIFNKKTGLIESRTAERDSGKDKWTEKLVACIGSEGIAERPDKKLGKFIDPITPGESYHHNIYYDKALRQFFRIDIKPIKTKDGYEPDFENSKVIKGPQLDNEKYDIVQIGSIKKGHLQLNFNPPLKKFNENDPNESEKRRRSSYHTNKHYSALNSFQHHLEDKSLALSSDGTIYRVDVNSLEIVSIAGNLPMGPTMLSNSEKPTPNNLTAYEVQPLVVDGQYKGLFATGVSRDNTGIALTVYDANGKRLTTEYSHPRYYGHSSSDLQATESIMSMPGGFLLMTVKYVVENLYPAGANVMSYAFCNSGEAIKNYSNILIIPDSFVAALGREPTNDIFWQIVGAFMLMLPSILIGCFLAWRVVKDAKSIGIGKPERRFWLIATIILGICGYISYRIARPKQTLVTCQNCGQLRRPDEERCHQCKAVWDISELHKPLWQVKNAPE